MRTIFAAPLVLAALLVGGLANADDQRVWSAEQLELIEKASKGPVGIEQDFEGWAAGYHPDWTYWRLGADEIRGRAEHMGLVRDFVDGGAIIAGFELQPVDVIIRGDVALLRYNAIETLNEDGEMRKVRFSSAAMYVKDDGEWRALATNIFYPPEKTE